MVELLLFYMITRHFSSPKKSVPQKKAHIDRIPANMSLIPILFLRTNAVCAKGGQGESFPLWEFEGETLKKEGLF